MSKQIIYVCDICGKQITNPIIKKEITYKKINLDLDYNCEQLDGYVVCFDCYAKIISEL